MALPKSKEWSRSLICRPRDNLTTEAGERALRHVAMHGPEKEELPFSMALLIGMEYGRAWLKERENFKKKVENAKPKVIKNDYEWWLKLRKTNKCFCAI